MVGSLPKYQNILDGYDNKKGCYNLRNFKLVGNQDSLTLKQFKSGKYITGYQTFELKLNGLPFKIEKIEIDNEEIDIKKFNINENILIVIKELTDIQIIGNK